MNKRKIIFTSIIALFFIGLFYYNSNNTRRKSVVKTKLLHFFNVLDPNWHKETNDSILTFTSPTMLVDGKFKSMEGPIVASYFKLNRELNEKEELLWITSFKTGAINNNSNLISDDFICHTNIDFMFNEHFSRWDLFDNSHRNFPRLTSISNGQTSYSFPNGFGFPIFNNERINIQTQVLNHNYPDTIFKLKHKIEIGYSKHNKKLKPLISTPIYIKVPYAKDYKEKNINMIRKTECLPVDERVYDYDSIQEKKHTGFWMIPKGKSSYSYNVSSQLTIKDSLQLHMIVPHLHPFTEKLHLIDKTKDSILFTSNVTNFNKKIGLRNTSIYKDTKGMTLYKNHEYMLKVEINNKSNTEQDMMAAFFCFFLDEELASKIDENINLK
jgi:hypothetical protein